MFDGLFKTAGTLQQGLRASSLRNDVINNNIANAETPGFKSSSVVFEDLFQQALQGSFATKTTDARHIAFTGPASSVEAKVVQNNDTTQRMDGNNVDIDFQNAELARNQIYYTALVEKLNGEYRRLRMAIREGS